VDRHTRELARLASNGDRHAAADLQRLLIDRPCSDGGLAHELLPPRRLTFKNADGSLHTVDRVSTCDRCKAEVPYYWVHDRQLNPPRPAPAPVLLDYLKQNEAGEFVAHIRTSPLEG
jgi:hypothetical protein